jgi:hypothetical protein
MASEVKDRPAPRWAVCEYQVSNGHQCCDRAAYAYPAMGGGWMQLCVDHAQRHLAYCITRDDQQEARRG